MVFPAKYRRAVFDVSVDQVLREVCLEIEKRYQIKFLEIGIDEDHVHFLLRTTQKFKIAYNHRCSPIKYKEINANII